VIGRGNHLSTKLQESSSPTEMVVSPMLQNYGQADKWLMELHYAFPNLANQEDSLSHKITNYY
jgi:hypothetical protein